MTRKLFMGKKDSQVWFVVQEPTRIEHLVHEGLSLVGLFRERQVALDYLRDEVMGSEAFDTITWKYGPYSNYQSGYDIDGYYYVVSTEEVQ